MVNRFPFRECYAEIISVIAAVICLADCSPAQETHSAYSYTSSSTASSSEAVESSLSKHAAADGSVTAIAKICGLKSNVEKDVKACYRL